MCECQLLVVYFCYVRFVIFQKKVNFKNGSCPITFVLVEALRIKSNEEVTFKERYSSIYTELLP